MNALPVLMVAVALLAIALAFARLLRGPTQADRVIALDLVFSASIVLTAAAAMVSGRVLFLDVAIGLALLGFVVTSIWARLIERSLPPGAG
ncbi:MAG: monovalent cation/H+ antiporter complex subunit F [Gammaproteobacteria bacterium]|nr:monovalent cation/H+ antiporter complex subunit F [Gammaproteobacteria bacterium]